MHLTAAWPNFLENAEFSANFLTTNITLNVFYWSSCVLWAPSYGNNYISTDHIARI